LLRIIFFIAGFISSGYLWADEGRTELAGVYKYLDQKMGSNDFFGVSAKREITPGFYVGLEVVFPSDAYNNNGREGFAMKEHGGLVLAFRSFIAENLYYELSLTGGIAMGESVETSGDVSGICDCTYGFVEPNIHLLYQVTPTLGIGGLIGELRIFSENENANVYGLEVAAKF